MGRREGEVEYAVGTEYTMVEMVIEEDRIVIADSAGSSNGSVVVVFRRVAGMNGVEMMRAQLATRQEQGKLSESQVGSRLEIGGRWRRLADKGLVEGGKTTKRRKVEAAKHRGQT